MRRQQTHPFACNLIRRIFLFCGSHRQGFEVHSALSSAQLGRKLESIEYVLQKFSENKD
jgi:hypothetical protein